MKFQGSSAIWNGRALTARKEGSGDRLTIYGGDSWGSGEGVYYQNLPEFLKETMPLFGTQDVNTGNTNTLKLTKKTKVYLFRLGSWSSVPLDGWTYLGMGSYLARYGSNVKLYTKEMGSGSYEIDNYSALYLFDEDY